MYIFLENILNIGRKELSSADDRRRWPWAFEHQFLLMSLAIAQLAKASMISWATRIGAVPGSIPESKTHLQLYSKIRNIFAKNIYEMLEGGGQIGQHLGFSLEVLWYSLYTKLFILGLEHICVCTITLEPLYGPFLRFWPKAFSKMSHKGPLEWS